MLVRNATLADGSRRDVRIDGETIAEVAPELEPDDDERERDATDQRELDADGKRLLPGMIDVHVHFREPGFAHKETWASGSRAAAAGGVTTVVDQPNTEPPTVDGAAFDEKAAIAAADSVVDWGINGGVTESWDPESLLSRPLFALGEVFLADSTGEMGIDTSLFGEALDAATEAGVPVTVHAEDDTRFVEGARTRDGDDADAWSAYRMPDAEVAAIEYACDVAADRGARIHVAHTSTPRGIDRARGARMTCEVTPHHMLLSREDLEDLGTLGRMNPPLRSEDRRQGVYERVADGTVDVIATDHAPHTLEEKDASIWEAPSGVPGVETALPLLLAEVVNGDLTFERVRDLTAANPAEIFDLPSKGRIEEGRDADLVLVDPDDVRTILAADLHTRCGWTPFEGHDGVFPEWTMVRGEVVYERGDGFSSNDGENVRTA